LAFARPSLRERIEQLSRPNRQGTRQLDDVFQRYVPLAAFHAADIIPMETGSLRQLFLGIATLLSQRAHGLTED
jgi:hypothetical protein